MLIIQKLETTQFSKNELIIKEYILNNKDSFDKLSIKDIAEKIYVSSSLLIIFAKKLGYDGWNKFKNDFVKEREYLNSHFKNIDANIPFNKIDNIVDIANKIAVLEKETIDDTIALINHDELKKAVELLHKNSIIYVFGSSFSYMASQEFIYSMKRLGKLIEYIPYNTEQVFLSWNIRYKSCAIVISYTGETEHNYRICRALKEKNIPIISLTGIGENSINKLSDIPLFLSTRENVHSKINSYSSSQSIHTLLNILYSGVFALDFEKNYKNIVDTNLIIETNRFSSNKDINK